MNLELLKEPFAPSDVSWRIAQAGKKASGEIWAKVLAYIDNRNIQERLDAVVGPANWKNEYAKGPEGGVLCGLSIRIDGEWVTKWDGAENSDIEPIKGGLSDSMKRAAVQWGIGRYLYDLGESFADVISDRRQGAHYANCKIKVNGKEEWATFYWLPPRGVLPGDAEPPKAEAPKPAAKAKAQKVAEQHGLTPASELTKQPSAFEKAKKEIQKAVQTHDLAHLDKVGNLVAERVKEGVISKQEDACLITELSTARRQIEALKNQPDLQPAA